MIKISSGSRNVISHITREDIMRLKTHPIENVFKSIMAILPVAFRATVSATAFEAFARLAVMVAV